jgi:5-methylcytosine-specific restriction endonuclease McrA
MSNRQRRERHALAEAQNWRCAYCGKIMGFDTVSIEHVIPRWQGGSDDLANKVAACKPCNSEANHTLHRNIARTRQTA